MSEQPKTVVAAMSGGVDSSVAAALLVQQGYRVIGVTLLFRPCDDDGSVNWCCGVGAAEQAGAVAGGLGIPHYALDCSAEFERDVLRPAWTEYERGRTPSPCVHCNRAVKFGFLMRFADKVGADFIASGHYARLEGYDDPSGPRLKRGFDPNKDQSYFLFSLQKQQLGRVLFPLGDLSKPEVRELARRNGFRNAERKESQDACFAYPDGGFAEGLRKRFGGKSTKGFFVDDAGSKLGPHKGIHRYTVGQRKGLGIALGTRAYVAGIEAETGNIEVSSDPKKLVSTGLVAEDLNWIGIKPPSPHETLSCKVQIRYRHRAVPARVTLREDGQALTIFDEPQNAVAPGQAVVFYHEEEVLGGGWIVASVPGDSIM